MTSMSMETEHNETAGAEPGPATRKAARNAVMVSAALMAGKVATLAYTIAAARVLGTQKFGLFAYALSISLLIATLPSWGFDSLLLQRGSKEPGALNRFLTETLVWRTIVAVPVFGGAAIAAIVTQPDGTALVTFLLVLVATAIDTYSDAGYAVAAARQDQRWTSAALAAQRFVTAGLAVGALALGFSLVGLAVCYLAGSVVSGIGVLWSVRRLGVRVDRSSVNRRGMAATARTSVALGVDTVISLALFRIDQVLLGVMKGDGAVGVYAAAYRLLETVLFVSWAVAKAVFPVMSASTESWRVRRGVEQGLAAIGVLYIPFGVGLAVEGHAVLELLYGHPFAVHGTAAVEWLSGAPFVFAAAYLGSYALLSKERRWKVVGSSLGALVVNVATNLALIPAFSAAGAAAATTLSYLAQTILVFALLVPDIGVPRVLRGLAPATVAAGLMAALLVPLHAGLAVEIPAGVAVYGIAWFLLARWWTPEQVAVIASLAPGRGRGSAGPGAPGPEEH
jgi:O-antigen/teichoic acid export membrane protein